MNKQRAEEMTAQSELAIMDRLAIALEKLSNAQPAVATRIAFETPEFDGNGDLENYIQQYLEVAAANDW